MIELLHTSSTHIDFQKLASELEREIFVRDGALADINYQLNKVGFMNNAIVLYVDNNAVACGAFRDFSEDTIEIKRMYVSPLYRRDNFASKLLSELESLARKSGYKYAVLETGKNQPEAISLYLKHGYIEIEKFGKYIESLNSVCFKKEL